MMRPTYHNRRFRSFATTGNGEVDAATLFLYQEEADVIWADYSGGEIARGHLLGIVCPDGSLEFRYHHVNRDGELRTGTCVSTPEVLPDGRLRLHEAWQWTSGDGSSGESVIEEVAAPSSTMESDGNA